MLALFKLISTISSVTEDPRWTINLIKFHDPLYRFVESIFPARHFYSFYYLEAFSCSVKIENEERATGLCAIPVSVCYE